MDYRGRPREWEEGKGANGSMKQYHNFGISKARVSMWSKSWDAEEPSHRNNFVRSRNSVCCQDLCMENIQFRLCLEIPFYFENHHKNFTRFSWSISFVESFFIVLHVPCEDLRRQKRGMTSRISTESENLLFRKSSKTVHVVRPKAYGNQNTLSSSAHEGIWPSNWYCKFIQSRRSVSQEEREA